LPGNGNQESINHRCKLKVSNYKITAENAEIAEEKRIIFQKGTLCGLCDLCGEK